MCEYPAGGGFSWLGCLSLLLLLLLLPHICGMDIYGMKIMPLMSDIATIQDIYGRLIFEDEHAKDVQNLTFVS